MADKTYDVAIIGGGPGGYAAAFRAGQLGLSAALVEVFKTGGVCLHVGCVPFKALEESARFIKAVRLGPDVGVNSGPVKTDLGKMIERKDAIVKRLEDGLKFLIQKYKVDYFQGLGSVVGPNEVAVRDFKTRSSESIKAANIIIATGSKPRALPGLKADGRLILYSDHIVTKKDKPKSIVIIGGGPIGVETATFYRALASDVTIVEVAPRLMMPEDEEISFELAKRFEEAGIILQLQAEVHKALKSENGVKLSFKDKEGKEREASGDVLLVAAGREGFLDGLNLETAGVVTDRGYIKTDRMMRSSVENIYCVGDASGPPLLAHKAMAEGIVAVEAIAGKSPRPVNLNRLPHCTYCDPQIGSVGLTEAQAKATGADVAVGRSAFKINAKALCEDDGNGFVKAVFDKSTGEILGAHIIGSEATELIPAYAAAMAAESTIEDFADTLFAHPTRSEALKEAALDVLGRPLNR